MIFLCIFKHEFFVAELNLIVVFLSASSGWFQHETTQYIYEKKKLTAFQHISRVNLRLYIFEETSCYTFMNENDRRSSGN